MPKRIYVGNLPFSASDDQVRELFQQFGRVHSVSLPLDRLTRKPKGFGYVELEDDAAKIAIKKLNGYLMDGNSLNVNEA